MKRPLLLFSISMIVGILTAQSTGSYLLALLIPISALVFYIIVFYKKIPELMGILIGMSIFFILGSCEYLYTDGKNVSKFNEFVGKEVIIEGIIDTEPDIREQKVMYAVKTKKVTSEGISKEVSGRVLFTTLKDTEKSILSYGREVKITGQLNVPSGKRNPGGFDYRRYLAGSGMTATIYASGNNVITGKSTGGNFLVTTGLNIRNRIVGVINASLPMQQAGLLNGMLIGYREGLTKEVEEAFSDAGLTHLMAVSGANIAFIVFPLVFIFRKMYLKQRTANAIIIGILVLFVFVTGFSPSVLRAVIMAITVLVGQMLRRETDVITSIAFAAMLLMFYNPYSIFDIGFQLSFAATLSLIMFYKSIKSFIDFKYIPNFIADVMAATLAAQVGVLPITTFYFNKISLISVVSNILAVPVVQIISILGFVMAILGQINVVLSQILGYINYTFLTFVLYVTKISSELPYATIKVITPSVPIIIVYYILIVFFLWYKPKYNVKVRHKHYAAAVGIIMLVVIINLLLPKNLEVVFIDVGQGDSAFIRTHSGKTVLIDGGGRAVRTQSEASVGDTVVVPFLLDYGVTKLDVVIATHGHEDHAQGLEAVLKSIKVDNLVIPYSSDTEEFKQLLNISRDRNIQVTRCETGDDIKIDGKTYFTTLFPKKSQSDMALNERCLVLKLYYKDISILFTGDIEKGTENTLLEENADIKADVLKVAHHGSASSTGEEFLKRVAPKAAVISVGKNNFGHPSPIVIDRISDSRAKIFRTDESGAVILTSDGENIKIRTTLQNKSSAE
ncbi:MAG: DNA internalization-related competence protein ComEC/Rec2 [Clostridia bacterium]|nr:DNA internalization-related competence protein ComEC/Rec2 [Clostridia bacterium]